MLWPNLNGCVKRSSRLLARESGSEELVNVIDVGDAEIGPYAETYQSLAKKMLVLRYSHCHLYL